MWTILLDAYLIKGNVVFSSLLVDARKFFMLGFILASFWLKKFELDNLLY